MKTSVTTKIKDIKFGAKEDTITLTIDGNISDQQANILRAIKKTGVAFVSFSSSQLDIDDVRPADREGLSYTVNKGEVEVEDKDRQMSMDDVDDEELQRNQDDDPMAGVRDEDEATEENADDKEADPEEDDEESEDDDRDQDLDDQDDPEDLED